MICSENREMASSRALLSEIVESRAGTISEPESHGST
jgi:hypothetical protein